MDLLSNIIYIWASLVVQMVKNPPAMQVTWIRSLGWEDILEKQIATHSSILVRRIPWRGVGGQEYTHTHYNKR